MKFYYLLIVALFLFASDKTFAQNNLPNLSGVNAVNELKKQGIYESLKDATNAVAANNSAFAQQTKLTASDGGTTDQFSQSIAISGDTAVVGAIFADDTFNNQGVAYVFARQNGGWTQQAKLVASDPNDSAAFGISVAISGETAVVGCQFCDSVQSVNDNVGAVYVYTRSGTTWAQQAKIVEANGAGGNQFGLSVGISFDTIAVGTRFQNSAPFKDRAYIFTRSGSNWTQQAILQPSDNVTFDQLGRSIAIDGNTVVIGCFFCDVVIPNNDNVGAAYVFKRTGTTWTQQAKLLPDTFNGSDGFGHSVSICSDTIVVGAIFKDADITTNDNQGAAYVFTRSANTWTQQQKLVASDPDGFDQFGSGVGISGNTIVVGSQFAPIGANSNQGAAYIYTRNGSVWTQQQKVFDPNGLQSADFGTTAAISNGTVIVGAVFDDINGRENQGSAVIFKALSDTWTPQRTIASDGMSDDRFGSDVAISGDTAVVGAFSEDHGVGTNQGAAYIFVRQNGMWVEQAKLISNDGDTFDFFGISVDISGDTVIIGARTKTIGTNTAQGVAYIFDRTGTTWTQTQRLTASDAAAMDDFGVSVAIKGDTAIVGADSKDNLVVQNQGAAYIFTRTSPTVWTQQAKITALDGLANDNFGFSVDVDGNTVVVGAWTKNNVTVSNQGAAYIFVRDANNLWMQEAKLLASDGATLDRFGFSAALDGTTAIIGAYNADISGNADAGAAYIFNRSVTMTGATWTQTQKLTADDNAANDTFGASVGIDNKVLVVGSPLADVSGKTDQGATYVFTLDGANWTQLSKLMGDDSLANDKFGSAVAVSGATVVSGADVKTINGSLTRGAAYFSENFNNAATAQNECSGFTPTAAGAEITGFVRGANNRGLSKVSVQLTTQNGEIRSTFTNYRGEFSFKNLPVNQVYFVKPITKRFDFAPSFQTLNLLGDDASLNFVGHKR
ncbi:MAG: hypothetical protein H7Z37_06805 [Pyrinomonadaceae bacterium]|nr:hypothetical protein [Pyrinomonadaceae bacterium]